MSEFARAVRRARSSGASNNAAAVVAALEPHLAEVRAGRHFGAALDLAWALGTLGRCAEAEGLLSVLPRRDTPSRLEVSLARAGWF